MRLDAILNAERKTRTPGNVTGDRGCLNCAMPLDFSSSYPFHDFAASAAAPDCERARKKWLELYRSEKDKLSKSLSRIAGSETAAQDAVQDAIVRLLGNTTVPESHVTYGLLYATAYNLVLNQLRSEKRRLAREAAFSEAHPQWAPADVQSTLEAREQLSRIEAALDGLGERCRTAFLTHRISSTTYSEIARELNVSVSMIEKYISKAALACKNAIETDA